MEQNIKYKRNELRDYLNFLKARDHSRKRKLYDQLDYNVITSTFPVWLIKSSEVAKTLPKKIEMFDYLIIDEASQCDIPSILPLLQRAKNCIVVGDKNQLNHISFTSKSFESILRNEIPEYDKHLCRYRDLSFFSLVNDNIDPQNVSYLSEHFRSKHAIIEFSNQEIYNNQLEILTKRPVSDLNSVEMIHVVGRNSKSINNVEAEKIIERVLSIIALDQKLPNNLKSTIGILSPFRNQVDVLQAKIKKELSVNQIKSHRIMVGTAFTFQGNERDIMLLSLVVDEASHIGSYNYINRKDVFNVSITRAKSKQIVYHSFNPKQLKQETTLSAFFDFYKKYKTHFVEDFEKNKFCTEIENYIASFNFNTWQKFEVSGVKIDILAEKNGKYVAIDLVGFPGEVGDFYKLERYRTLERGGIRLFPLPYAYWLYDKEFCLNAIQELLIA